MRDRTPPASDRLWPIPDHTEVSPNGLPLRRERHLLLLPQPNVPAPLVGCSGVLASLRRTIRRTQRPREGGDPVGWNRFRDVQWIIGERVMPLKQHRVIAIYIAVTAEVSRRPLREEYGQRFH